MPRRKNSTKTSKVSQSVPKGGDEKDSEKVIVEPTPAPLILTSEKKRGVYECDCCRVDISQAPRIHCAVCADYDICLDCFIRDDSVSGSLSSSSSVGKLHRHKPSVHGYRVADSTRFPLFPSLHGVVSATTFCYAAATVTTTNAVNSRKSFPVTGKSTEKAFEIDVETKDQNDKGTPMEIPLDSQRVEMDPASQEIQTLTVADSTVDIAAAAVSSRLDALASSSISISNMEDDTRPSHLLDINTVAMTIDDVNHHDSASNNIPQDTNTMDDLTSFKVNINSEPLPRDSQNNISTDIPPIAAENTIPIITTTETSAPTVSSSSPTIEWVSTDDPKCMWTVEEDLRLLDAIQSFGVGNWEDISEAVGSGFSSVPPLLTHALSSISLNASSHSTTNSGNTGTIRKTSKHCMERYLDDYLGRYGHIVPPFLFEEELDYETRRSASINQANVYETPPIMPIVPTSSSNDTLALVPTRMNFASSNLLDDTNKTMTDVSVETGTNIAHRVSTDNAQPVHLKLTTTRKRKRNEDLSSVNVGSTPFPIISSPQLLSSRVQNDTVNSKVGKAMKMLECDFKSPSTQITKHTILATPIIAPKKKYRIIPSSSTQGYDSLWPIKYIPPIPGVKLGDEVGREVAYRAEQTFHKQINTCPDKDEADRVRKLWEETRLNKPDGPRVLPYRLDDIKSLPGADLVGYMPRRVDLDVEWDNDAELILAEMEFSPTDSAEDRALKVKVIEIYNKRLNEREKRKQFLVDRNLLDYKKNQMLLQKLPAEERDLVNRMRLFARFHSADEHETFVQNLLKAKLLRKEIAKLQMYRRMGIRSMSEVERWELDLQHRALSNTVHSSNGKSPTQSVGALAGMDQNVSDSTTDASDRKHGGNGGSNKPGHDLWKKTKSYRNSDRSDRVYRQDCKIVDTSIINKDDSKSSTVEKCTDSIDLISCPESSNMDIDAMEERLKAPVDVDDVEIKQLYTTRNIDDLNFSENGLNVVVNEPNPSTQEDQCDSKEQAVTLGGSVDDKESVRDPLDSLLSSKEIELCKRLSLLPSHYVQVKTVLIREYLSKGRFHQPELDSYQSIVKIDIHKYNNVVEFCMRNGWISR